MSFDACAAIVEKGDPDRFRATMAAPVAARRILFPLYAFNVEVTRAPWVTKEAMIAEMRLQWWRDALEEIAKGETVRKHEVVDALAEILDPVGAASLDALIVARRWDIYSDAFEDQAHFDSYIDATSGDLLWTASRLLGGRNEQSVHDLAYGIGVANLLQAIPALEDKGRKPLVDGTTDGVRSLAKSALARFQRGAAPKPVRLSGFMTKTVLSQAIKSPQRAVHGTLGAGPLKQAVLLAKAALF